MIEIWAAQGSTASANYDDNDVVGYECVKALWASRKHPTPDQWRAAIDITPAMIAIWPVLQGTSWVDIYVTDDDTGHLSLRLD